MKLSNWGHNKDFDTEGYFHYWKAIDEKNYMFVRNLHPVRPSIWHSLNYVEASDIQDLIRRITANKDLMKAQKVPGKFVTFISWLVPYGIIKLYRKLSRAGICNAGKV